jgi:multidrug/hemolysin transport system permease protein
MTNLPSTVKLSEKLIDGLVGGQLVSSILAVSCITVAFCSNFLMVQDKANGTIKDLMIAPVKSSVLSISYYVATLLSTLVICLVSCGICFIYLAVVGWYLTAVDVICLIVDVVLLSLLGTALSSLINFFLSTQGQISAVGAIISAGYGFICGAYMPISSFSEGLQKVLLFSPGTYGTSLVRNHSVRAVLEEIEAQGVPSQVIVSMKDALDCNLYFFGDKVSIPVMYLILGGTVVVLLMAYILLNMFKRKA